jgi:hypothetical protein
MRRMVFTLPAQVYPLTNRGGGGRARPLVNKSRRIGKTGMRRRSVPRNPSWSCTTSHHFRNRDHDRLGPRVSRGAVASRCLENA